MVFEKLKDAYWLGREYSLLMENINHFGHKMLPDNSEFLYIERYQWRDRQDEIDKLRKNFGLIERPTYELGYDDDDLSRPINHVLEQPLEFART